VTTALSTTEIDQRLAAAVARFTDAHPISREMAERAQRSMPGGNTRTTLHTDPFGVRIAGGEGAVLHTVDGQDVVDVLGDYSSGLVVRHPDVAAAIRAVVDNGWGYGAMQDAEAQLAAHLVSRFPSVDRIRFTNSGSEANLLAVLTARHVTGRPRLVVFDGAYHGGPMTIQAESAPLRVPFEYGVVRFNDPESVRAEFEENGDRIAAVLVEPMMGSAGCIPAEPGFLALLRDLTTDAGALLIFDEVMTSRFSFGGAQELVGVTPDLTTLGKYIAGGLSFGAFGGRADIMATFDPGVGGLAHGGTFNNNAFTMAAGVAVSRLVDAETLAAHHARGERLRDRLEEAVAPYGWTASGQSTLINLHPVAGPVRRPEDVAGADPRLRSLFFHELLDHGFYIAGRGYLALSLAVSDDQLDGFVAACAAAAAVADAR
jgi:glutamate-1-semialdehyde 2,1-aminomutase